MPKFNLIVNDSSYTIETEGDTPLLWVLRDNLKLTGTKYSCGQGICGCCVVHFNGVAVRSCVLPIRIAHGQKITTIEGLSKDGSHPIQQAWTEHDVPQCGYCQSGQIMTAASLLQMKPNPSDNEITEAFKGNLCRCGTYKRIKKAIVAASKAGGHNE